MTYNSTDGSLNTMTTGTGSTLTMGYDGLRRLTSVSGGPVTRQYTYRDSGSTKTTMQVASVTSSGQQYGYTYDSLGNIATYAAPGKGTVTYTYDNQGQLLKAAGDTTYTYTYDGAGNILTAYNGTTSHTYTYGDTGWRDLLTAFDGNSITYDAIGNPTSYYNGTRWTFGWANGRSLSTASKSGTSLSFAYDASGLRTGKTVSGTTYRYFYASGKLMRMTWGSNTVDFIYDANGMPYAMKYNGTLYYYVTNLQGDIMRVVNASGTVVASYDYDPYGKVISATGTLANVNPLRYRGYVYDTETGFYYLQSRYYDPEIGRFINADSIVATVQGVTGYNMYAYCGSNPVNRADTSGTIWHIVAGAVVGSAFGVVTKMVTNYLSGEKLSSGLITAGIAGAVSGGLAASGVGLARQVVWNAVISMTNNAADQFLTGEDSFDWGSMLWDGVIGAGAGLAGGSGAGSKNLTRIGMTNIKRVWNALTHKGVSAAASTLVKGLAYFAKNASYIQKPFLVALVKSSTTIISSAFAKKVAIVEWGSELGVR